MPADVNLTIPLHITCDVQISTLNLMPQRCHAVPGMTRELLTLFATDFCIAISFFLAINSVASQPLHSCASHVPAVLHCL